VVGTWNRNEIRVQAEHGMRDRVEIRVLGSVVTVKSQSRMGPPRGVDYRVTVPAQTDLRVSGVYQDVTIDGLQGSVEASTVNGDVTLRGGTGFVSLKSVEGDVHASGARAKLVLESINADAHVENSEGDIQATSTNGDVTMHGIVSSNVSAASVNGDVVYDGSVTDGGYYDLSTHNGDVTMSFPENANATVSVETFQGEFEPPFAVRVTQMRKNRFTFVSGSGSARINLESFQGTIRMARPGEIRRPRGNIRRGAGAGAGAGTGASDDGIRTDTRTKIRPDLDFDLDVDLGFLWDVKVGLEVDLRHLRADLEHLKQDVKREIKRELKNWD
jgi:hypothetical protein